MKNTTTEHVTLREYTDMRFEANEKAVNAALSTAEKAVLKAEEAANKRFDGVNEFRQTLADQQTNLMPRKESESKHNSLADRLKILEDAWLQKSGESGGAKNLWAIIVGIAGFIGIILTIIFRFT